MATHTATHRLRRPHNVLFDSARHFVDGPSEGARIQLPEGTHISPTALELQNMPDRFESLSVPETPAEREIDYNADSAEEDDTDTDSTGTVEEDPPDSTGTVETSAPVDSTSASETPPNDQNTEPDIDVVASEAADEMLESVGGAWDALTHDQLTELAVLFELEVHGTGSSGNILKADLVEAVREAHSATE